MNILGKRARFLVTFRQLIRPLHTHDVLAQDVISVLLVFLCSTVSDQTWRRLLIELISAIWLEKGRPLVMLVHLMNFDLAHVIRIIPTLDLTISHSERVCNQEVERNGDSLVLLGQDSWAFPCASTAWMCSYGLRLLIWDVKLNLFPLVPIHVMKEKFHFAVKLRLHICTSSLLHQRCLILNGSQLCLSENVRG